MALLELLGVWVDGPRDESVPWNTAVQIDLPRGSDATLGFVLVDSIGQPVDLDLAGLDRLVFSVRQPIGNDALFEILATKLAQVGRYQFVVASNRTIDYHGRLIYDVWATRAGAQQQVMFPAYLNVTPRMRNP
jgi:hypothetical protein